MAALLRSPALFYVFQLITPVLWSQCFWFFLWILVSPVSLLLVFGNGSKRTKFKIFFTFLVRSRYLSIFSLSFIFILWSCATAKSARWQTLLLLITNYKFPDLFVPAFKIVVHSWQFSMLLLYILWDDWPIFMISGSNEQLQQQFEYTLQKTDCHSWRISKMQPGHEDTSEERYAIKFFFKLGKMPRMECIRLLLNHLAWIEYQFLSGIRDSRKARESIRDDERCGRSKEIKTPELIGQRVQLRVTVTMLRF